MHNKTFNDNWITTNFAGSGLKEANALNQCINRWHQLAHVDTWLAWSSKILNRPYCEMDMILFDDLTMLNAGMQNWQYFTPAKYSGLQTAFEEFQSHLSQLLRCIEDNCCGISSNHKYSVKKVPGTPYDGDDSLEYAIHWLNTNHPTSSLDDMMVHLTMAANNIVDLIETQIFPEYGQMANQLQRIKKLTEEFFLKDLSFPNYVSEEEKLYADWINLSAKLPEPVHQPEDPQKSHIK